MEQDTSRHDQVSLDALGGRLLLIYPSDLNSEQKRLYSGIEQSQVARAKSMGYTAMLPDGRLIGPFNALLRNPPLAAAVGAWTSAIRDNIQPFLDDITRELIILSIGVHWKAKYVIYAHTIAARQVKSEEADIRRVLSSQEPLSDRRILTAYRVTKCLMDRERLDEQLYLEIIAELGEAGVVALIALIGQYMHTSILLNCFQVTVPR